MGKSQATASVYPTGGATASHRLCGSKDNRETRRSRGSRQVQLRISPVQRLHQEFPIEFVTEPSY